MTERNLFLFPDRSLFVGPLTDNGMHSHHALQIVYSPGPVTVELEKQVLKSSLTVIGPNVKHAVTGNHPLQCILLLDGESSLCQSIVRNCLENKEVLSLSLSSHVPFDVSKGDSPSRWIEGLMTFLPGQPLREKTVALDERIASACTYIQNDGDLRASLIELAQHTGLSEGRFTHLFKEQMGIPIRRYILWLRIRRAIEALKEGLSLTDAAYEAGFADQAHMSRSFKESFGSSPAELLTARGNVRITFCSPS